MTYPQTPGYAPRDTSKSAADSMEHLAGGIAGDVLAFITSAPALCSEVEVFLGLSHQTASARIRQLSLLGLVVDSGVRGKTPSGRQAIVWRRATEADSMAAPIVKRCPHCGEEL